MKRLRNDGAEFPFKVGDVVGFQGRRAEVRAIYPHSRSVHLRFLDNARIHKPTVSITELHDPPALPDHIEEAGRETAEFLRNPRVVFEESE